MKYAMVTQEVIDKMCNCFQSVDEIISFNEGTEAIAEEMVFMQKLRARMPVEAEASLRIKSVAMLIIFFRDNIELIRSLLQVCDIKSVSEEEMEEMRRKITKQLEQFEDQDTE